jgi:hypothetical protein
VDVAVSRLAGRQDGIVRLDQMGLTSDQIRRRVEKGRLHRLYQGVYAVGHMALTRRSHERAAVYACRPGAALSHQTAAARWGQLRWNGPIHVTAPRGRQAQDGFVLHRTRRLEREDVVILDGVPVTTVHRTLVDLADVLSERKLADAVHETEVQRLFDLTKLREAQARVPGRKGRHALDRVLEAYTERPLIRTDAEMLLKELCEEFDIPRPQFNVTRHGMEVDALWPDAGFAIEVDGRATHHTTKAFYADRKRDRVLGAYEDIQVSRVTWPDLTVDRHELAREIKALLRRRYR